MEQTIKYGYGPSKFDFIVVGAVALGGLGLMGATSYFSNKKDIAKIELEKVRTERGYVLQERDLNGNGIPEKFYTIDGKIAILESDGRPLSSSLDTKVLEKEE